MCKKNVCFIDHVHFGERVVGFAPKHYHIAYATCLQHVQYAADRRLHAKLNKTKKQNRVLYLYVHVETQILVMDK